MKMKPTSRLKKQTYNNRQQNTPLRRGTAAIPFCVSLLKKWLPTVPLLSGGLFVMRVVDSCDKHLQQD